MPIKNADADACEANDADQSIKRSSRMTPNGNIDCLPKDEADHRPRNYWPDSKIPYSVMSYFMSCFFIIPFFDASSFPFRYFYWNLGVALLKHMHPQQIA
jgi:hypothetical protein